MRLAHRSGCVQLMNGFRQDAPVASGSRFLKPEDFGSIVSDQPISTRALDAYIVDTLPKVAARLGTDKVLGVDHTLWDTLALYLPQGIDLPDQVSQVRQHSVGGRDQCNYY